MEYVKARLSTFGTSSLTKIINEERLRGRDFLELINLFMNSEWRGKDEQIFTRIREIVRNPRVPYNLYVLRKGELHDVDRKERIANYFVNLDKREQEKCSIAGVNKELIVYVSAYPRK